MNLWIPTLLYQAAHYETVSSSSTHGDGSPIPTRFLETALAAGESRQVLIKWARGDIVLLDVGASF